ncbi:hypothetical protein [Streptococcus mitis]|uniref:hypothetical protein n=1 Tax=Streptococcus mitis TaxID=28037 RepID=UPI002283E152|nr:hypothetical protein [Streptococcus mitis]MCY7153910.1 hypothetical protein [Streptococcus mitis]
MISQENNFNEFLLYRSDESNRILLNHFVNKMKKKSNYRNLENNELFSKFISNINIFYTIVRILREDNKDLTDKAFLDEYFKGDAPNSEKTLYNWIQRSKNFQNKVRTRTTKEVYIKHIRNIPTSFKLFDEFRIYEGLTDLQKSLSYPINRSDKLDLLQSFFKELEPRNLEIISNSIIQYSSELSGKNLTLHLFLDTNQTIVDLDIKSWAKLIDGLIENFKNVESSKDFNSASFNKEKSLNTIYNFLNILPTQSLLILVEILELVFNLKKYLKIELEPKLQNKLPKEIRNKKFLTSNVINQINDTLQTEIKSPSPHKLLIKFKTYLLAIIDEEAEFEVYMRKMGFTSITEYTEHMMSMEDFEVYMREMGFTSIIEYIEHMMSMEEFEVYMRKMSFTSRIEDVENNE